MVVTDLDLENPGEDKDGLDGILISCVGICSFIGFSVKGLFCHYILTSAPKGRPVNLLIFFDQGIQLLSGLFLAYLVLQSEIKTMTIAQLVGSESCLEVFLPLSVYSLTLAFGGLGMTCYRLLIYRGGLFQFRLSIGDQKPVKAVMAITTILTLITATISWMANKDNLKMPALNYCRGYSDDFIEVLEAIQYDQDLEESTKSRMLKFKLMIITCHLVEFLSYLVYSMWLRDTNNGDQMISNQALYRRKRKNVITMSGQAATFFAEIATFILAIILRKILGVNFDPRSFVQLFFVQYALLSLAHLAASPEIRDYVKMLATSH